MASNPKNKPLFSNFLDVIKKGSMTIGNAQADAGTTAQTSKSQQKDLAAQSKAMGAPSIPWGNYGFAAFGAVIMITGLIMATVDSNIHSQVRRLSS